MAVRTSDSFQKDIEGYFSLPSGIKVGFILEMERGIIGQKKVLSIKTQSKKGWIVMPEEPHEDLRLTYNWAWCHCFDLDWSTDDPKSYIFSVFDATKFIYSGLVALNEQFATDTERNIDKYKGCVQEIVKVAFEKYKSAKMTVILERP